MKRLGERIVKARHVILIVSILLLIPAAIGYFNTRVNYDLLYYLPDGIDTMEGQDILMDEFHAGAFKCAQQAKVPIVPVAIYDSHIAFDFNSLKKVTTQVFFMDPIYYEEYGELTTREISQMVKVRIEEGMKILDENRRTMNLNCNYYTR